MTDELPGGSARSAPRISVCLPVWQGAHLVDIAIQGLLAQTETDWELLVGDNASDDGLDQKTAGYADSRIRYLRFDDHVDVYDNFNRVINLASGRWILPLGADDSLHAHALATLLAAADGPGDAPVAVIAACRRVLPDGSLADANYYGSQRPVRVREGSYDAAEWLAIAASGGPFPWNIGSVAFSRDALRDAGAFKPEVGLAADAELIFRIAAFGRVTYLETPLLDFMVRPDSDGNQRWAAERRTGGQDTALARAVLEALAAHEGKREVSAEERRAVMGGAARTYLIRAAQHRTLPAGRGRAGALSDVRRAGRLDPAGMRHPYSLLIIAGALLAPAWLLRRLSAVMRDRIHGGAARAEPLNVSRPVRVPGIRS